MGRALTIAELESLRTTGSAKPKKAKAGKALTLKQLEKLSATKAGRETKESGFLADLSKSTASALASNVKISKRRTRSTATRATSGALGQVLQAPVFGKNLTRPVANAVAGLSLAAAAGLASYYGTTWILDRLAEKKLRATPEYIRYEKAMAYRQARLAAEQQLGRKLTTAENKLLGDQFKASLLTIGA